MLPHFSVQHCLLLSVVVSFGGAQLTSGEYFQRINGYLNGIERRLQILEGLNRQCSRYMTNVTSSLEEGTSAASECAERTEEYTDRVNEAMQNLENVEAAGTLLELDDSADAARVSVDVDPRVIECFNRPSTGRVDEKAKRLNCLYEYLYWEMPNIKLTLSPADMAAIRASVNLGRPSRPLSGHRVRKEYRDLTNSEKNKLHAAIQKLYLDGTLASFGIIHMKWGQHNGTAFLPWHRAFISLFEEALRQKDPDVSLPYWDTTFDYNMDNPVNSMLWTQPNFGTGTGHVTKGPFAGFTALDGPLERNRGARSRLISEEDIYDFVITRNKCHYADITRPTADESLEYLHDGVHSWIGGHMNAIETSAFDPVFYFLHCYTDYLWELFRERQRDVCRVNPATDYPNTGKPDHGAEDRMPGMEFFRNLDGMADWWTGGDDPWYSYEVPPTCPRCGESRDLVCDTMRDRCMAASRETDLFGRPVETTPFMASTTPAQTVSTMFFSSSAQGTSTPGPERRGFRVMAMEVVPTEEELLRGANESQELTEDLIAFKNVVPKKFGNTFAERPSDGRTLNTALQDAIKFELDRRL